MIITSESDLARWVRGALLESYFMAISKYSPLNSQYRNTGEVLLKVKITHKKKKIGEVRVPLRIVLRVADCSLSPNKDLSLLGLSGPSLPTILLAV